MERYCICRQFGAQIHLLNPALGFGGAKKYVQKLSTRTPTTCQSTSS